MNKDDEKKEKFFDVEAMLGEDEAESREVLPEKPQRIRRPSPAIASLNNQNNTTSVTDGLKIEKKKIEKTLEKERKKFEEETSKLLEELEEAKSEQNGGKSIVLTMPVTKQDVSFELCRIDPAFIDVSPLNERRQEFLDELSLQDILPSIRKNKQQKPGTLRPKQDGRYELIEGSRRLAAVKIAEQEYLGLVGNVPDADVYALSVIENKHKDVSPYEKSLAFQRLLETQEYDSWNQIGAVNGISSSHIARYKACTELDEIFVRILPCPSDMPLNYGETIRLLRKQNESELLSKAEELLTRRGEAADKKDSGGLLDIDGIIKELKKSVRVKAKQPKTWQPVIYKSKDAKVVLKHSVSSAGSTKFEISGANTERVSQALEYLKGALKVSQ